MNSDFKQSLKGLTAILDYDISNISSMGVGGKVAAFITAESFEELKTIHFLSAKHRLKFLAVGGGTNIVFNEGFLNLVAVKLGKRFNYMNAGAKMLEAGASFSLQKFVVESARHGFDFSPLAGIPGTLGGAVCGNSGNICSHIEEIDCMFTDGGRGTVRLRREDYGYRYFNQGCIEVILSIRLKAPRADPPIIFDKIREFIKQKRMKQPLKEKSAGCFFKNPQGQQAGKLIDGCGLKGFRYGEAAVSSKHANFIINMGNASAEDVFVLARIISNLVCSKYNIKLENEVRMIGFENGKGS